MYILAHTLYIGTKTYWRDDKAKDPLFSFVSKEALGRLTFKSFVSLLDNYEAATGLDEEVTQEEIRENRAFINAICETKVITFVHSYIVWLGFFLF